MILPDRPGAYSHPEWNTYSVSTCSPFLNLFFKSAKLEFLHFNLEEKNEGKTFWYGHHAAGSSDSNGHFPGNVGNGKYVVIAMGTLDIMLPEEFVWVDVGYESG